MTTNIGTCTVRKELIIETYRPVVWIKDYPVVGPPVRFMRKDSLLVIPVRMVRKHYLAVRITVMILAMKILLISVANMFIWLTTWRKWCVMPWGMMSILMQSLRN
jgi:hypothetical protein